MASYKEQGDGGLPEMETDPSSHRARYARRKTAHDKVCGEICFLAYGIHACIYVYALCSTKCTLHCLIAE